MVILPASGRTGCTPALCVSLSAKLAMEQEHRQPWGVETPSLGHAHTRHPAGLASFLLGLPASPLPTPQLPPGKSKGSTWWLRLPPASFSHQGAGLASRWVLASWGGCLPRHVPLGESLQPSSPGTGKPSWLPTLEGLSPRSTPGPGVSCCENVLMESCHLRLCRSPAGEARSSGRMR